MACVLLEDTITDAELAKYREKYASIKVPTETEQFEYALCLMRTKHTRIIEESLVLFQTLFASTKDENIKRDSLYYMAIAETKLNNYESALKYLRSILKVEPTNEQVIELHKEVEKRMQRDGLIGAGIVGGAALVGAVGLLGLGAALFAKRK